MPVKKTIEEFVRELHKRNIQYSDRPLSLLPNQQYKSTHDKLEFRCINRHQFLMAPLYVLKGHDCKQCSTKKVGDKNRIDHHSFLCKLNSRNRKFSDKILLCDGQKYTGTYTPLMFMCEQGHTFSSLPKTVMRGSGCPQCKVAANVDRHAYSLDQFVVLLEERNKALPHKQVFIDDNARYNGYQDHLLFRCQEQHVWQTKPMYILQAQSGCPVCAARKEFSVPAIMWLEQISKKENIHIQHAKTPQGEFRIPGTRFRADGFCKETNTIYEFYGDFWHGNPAKFNPDDVNEHVGRTYGELYQKTIEREQMLRSLGYNVVTIWWSEFVQDRQPTVSISTSKDFFKCLEQINLPHKQVHEDMQRVTSDVVDIYFLQFTNCVEQVITNRRYLVSILDQATKTTLFVFEDEWDLNSELVLNKIKHYISGNISKRIHARHCHIEQVSHTDKAHFLNQHHIQGNDNCQIAYGAYFNNELVAVMTFTAPRVALGYKNKDRGTYRGTFELSRFTTNISYRIPGIASKLLKHFQNNHDWKQIFSFADRRWSIGNLYYKLGFKLARINGPDYFYIIDGVRKHRWNYRKDILKYTLPNYNPSATEYQNMLNHGYDRVWDCGTLKFTLLFTKERA